VPDYFYILLKTLKKIKTPFPNKPGFKNDKFGPKSIRRGRGEDKTQSSKIYQRIGKTKGGELEL
jgi:hypothetical protein